MDKDHKNTDINKSNIEGNTLLLTNNLRINPHKRTLILHNSPEIKSNNCRKQALKVSIISKTLELNLQVCQSVTEVKETTETTLPFLDLLETLVRSLKLKSITMFVVEETQSIKIQESKEMHTSNNEKIKTREKEITNLKLSRDCQITTQCNLHLWVQVVIELAQDEEGKKEISKKK